MRLVHLAPASKERGIRRAGLAGARATFAIAKGEHLELRRAVYAMPVVADFWTTFQWLVHLVESLELAACDAAVVAALERFARHADASVRAAVARAARAQLDDLDGAGALRERLGALA